MESRKGEGCKGLKGQTDDFIFNIGGQREPLEFIEQEGVRRV